VVKNHFDREETAMQRLLVTTVLTISATTSALADASNLAGTSYAFTGSAACINSQQGFNQNFTPMVPDAWLESFSVEGIRTFNSGGIGTVTGNSTGVDFGTGKTAASSSAFMFSLLGAIPYRRGSKA
jgi:hypothetical protein